MQKKYYKFDWLEPSSVKWEFLLNFVKTETNIIEFFEPLFPEYEKEKMEFIPFAQKVFENLNEIEFFDEKLKPVYKYFSILEQQSERERPHLFYKILSSDNRVDKLFTYRLQNDFWANHFSLPSFYKDEIPIIWFADIYIVIGVNEIQRKSFKENGFDLKLCEKQIYPTKEIDINNVEIQQYN